MRINGNDLLFNNFYFPSRKIRISKQVGYEIEGFEYKT